jgi:hypothetical protein
MPVLKPMLAIENGALAFKGKLIVPTASALSPSATGVRLFVTDGHGATVLDALAPAGAFDAATKSGWKALKFKSPSGAIAALALTQKKKTLAEVAFKMSARLAPPTAGALALPLTASLVLDSTSPVSPCGDARFVGPVAVNPTCTLKKDALACRQQKKR